MAEEHSLTRPPWRALVDGDDHRTAPRNESLLPVPEPSHDRISMLSSGMSLRYPRRATLDKIVEACKSYEKRCEGKYASNSLGTRYLFQLSKEVQIMVADLKRNLPKKNGRARKADGFNETQDQEQENVDILGNRVDQWRNIEERRPPKVNNNTNKKIEILRKKNTELSRKIEQANDKLQDFQDRQREDMDMHNKMIRAQCRSEIEKLTIDYEEKLTAMENKIKKMDEQPTHVPASLSRQAEGNRADDEQQLAKLMGNNEPVTEKIANLEATVTILRNDNQTLREMLEKRSEPSKRPEDDNGTVYKNAEKEIEKSPKREKINLFQPSEWCRRHDTREHIHGDRHGYPNGAVIQPEHDKRLLGIENEYLRARVRELYKMLFACQSILEKQDSPSC